MSDSLSGEDVVELRAAVQAMIDSVPDVTVAGGYPVYPEAFREFTRNLSRSPWHRQDYTTDMKRNLRERIETLTLDEVRSFLTMMIRIDRFSPGGLLSLVKKGMAKQIVDRAAELVED